MKINDFGNNWIMKVDSYDAVNVSLPLDAYKLFENSIQESIQNLKIIYEKKWIKTKGSKNAKVYLHFMGISGDASLWVNDKLVGTINSYIPSSLDITDFLYEEHVNHIRVDNEIAINDSLKGAGILRPVTLIVLKNGEEIPDFSRITFPEGIPVKNKRTKVIGPFVFANNKMHFVKKCLIHTEDLISGYASDLTKEKTIISLLLENGINVVYPADSLFSESLMAALSDANIHYINELVGKKKIKTIYQDSAIKNI